MIAGITTVSLGQAAVFGLLIVGLYLLGHLGKRFIGLWIDNMAWRHAAPRLLDEYAADMPYAGFDTDLPDAVGLPGDREHSWPGEIIPPVGGYPEPTLCVADAADPDTAYWRAFTDTVPNIRLNAIAEHAADANAAITDPERTGT